MTDEIRVKPLARLPKRFKSVPATPGTAAYEYISKQKSPDHVPEDPRLLGGIQEPDGALLVFRDGSSVLIRDPIKVQ
jgi:hypothetical protein